MLLPVIKLLLGEIHDCLLVVDFEGPDVNINAEPYANTLRGLRVSISNKRFEKFTNAT